MFQRFVSSIALSCSILTLPACATVYPPSYSAEAIEARVIDAETKQSLEDVIITANWELRGGGLALGGSSYAGQLMVMEAVTDVNGKFYFPAWGPIRQSKGELQENDPKLIFFKSGYRYKILSNEIRNDPDAALEPVRRSRWNGRTIALERFKGTVEEYARHLSSIDIDLRFAYDNENCELKHVPRMVAALHREEKRFRDLKVYNSLHSLGYYLGPNYKDKCGIKEPLRKYLHE